MTNTDLKDQIDGQITSATTKNSVTPTIVGENLKDVVDYTDQEITQVTNGLVKTIGSITAVSTFSIGSGGGVITNDFTTVDVLSSGNNKVAIDSTNTEIGKVYSIRNIASEFDLQIIFKTGTKFWSEETDNFSTTYTLPALGTVEFVYAENNGTDKVYHVRVVHTTNTYAAIYDDVPTLGSDNAIKSTAVFVALTGKANDIDVVNLTDNQTISGDKIFDGTITVPTPTINEEAANKLYVDSAIDTYAAGDINRIATVKVTLTQSNILSLFSTPITLLTAGSRDVLYPLSIYLIKDSGTAYSFSDPNFVITDDLGTTLNQIPNSAFSAVQGFVSTNLTAIQNRTGVTKSSSFKLKALAGNPSGGTGSIDVYLTYVILKIS